MPLYVNRGWLLSEIIFYSLSDRIAPSICAAPVNVGFQLNLSSVVNGRIEQMRCMGQFTINLHLHYSFISLKSPKELHRRI